MKKLLSLALSLLMILSVVPSFAFSALALEDSTVAVIGETEYESLFGESGALANAKEGETVVLVKDTKETGGVTLDKSIILDLAGHTVINYSTAVILDASNDITVRSTVDGMGEVPTENKAELKYSGTLLSTSASVTIDNVKTMQANNFAEYGEENLIVDPTWEHKRFRYQNNYWGLGTYDNYTRTANTTLIPVEPSTTYYFDYETELSDSFKMEVFSYKTYAEGDAHKDTAVTAPNGEEVSIIGKLGDASKGVLTTGSTTEFIGINVYCSNNEWSYNNSKDKIMPKLKDGTIKTAIYKVIDLCDSVTENNAFVSFKNSDVVEFNMTNSVVNQVNGYGRNKIDSHCYFNFTTPVKINVADSTINWPGFDGKIGMTVNNANVSGTFKNTNFILTNGNTIDVKNTSDDGLTFDNCKMSSTGDGRVPCTINGGTVNFVGGTTVTGNKSTTKVLVLIGGNVYINDATIMEDKGDGSTKMPLDIREGCNLKIEKAHINKGGSNSSLVNDSALLWAAIEKGYAVYNSTVHNEDTVISKGVGVSAEKEIYIEICEHNLKEYDATCTEGGICSCCGLEIPALGHTETYESTSTAHKQKCQRCGFVGEEEEHSGGTATCVSQALCEKCNQPYGELGDHSFANYKKVDATYKCDHYCAEVSDCANGCGAVGFRCQLKKNPDQDDKSAEDYYIRDVEAESELTITKQASEPTCVLDGHTEEKTCPECGTVIIPSTAIPAKGHIYGDTVVETEPDYFNEGTGYQICKVCGDRKDVSVPKLSFKSTIVAIIGDKYDESAQQFTSIFGEGGAYEAAEPGQTIMLVKDAKEKSTEEITVDKDLVIDLVGHTLTSQLDKGINATANITFKNTKTGLEGSEDAETKGKIIYSTTLVNSSATTTFDNVEVVAEADKSAFVSTTTAETENVAKLVIKNCKFNVSNTGASMAALSFNNSNTVEVDVQDTEFQSGTGSGIYFNSTGVTGKFENCKFYKAKDSAVSIAKTGEEGVEFNNCYFKESSWDSTTFSMSGGNVALTGGTIVDGCNIVTTVVNISGGTLVLDGVTIKGDKGTDSNRKLLNIGSSADIVFKNAALIRGTANGAAGVIYNNNDLFWANINGDDSAVYTREGVSSGEYAYEMGTDVSKQKAVYIGKCSHDESGITCTEAGNCKFCGRTAPLDHNGYNAYAGDETGHWKVCEICGEKDPTDNTVYPHNGGVATCERGEICEDCGYEYGTELGHDFTNSVIASDESGHWIVCERDGCTGKKEGSFEAHTCSNEVCGEKRVCDICGREYGDPVEHDYGEYEYQEADCTHNAYEVAVCSRCGNEDREMVEVALGHNWVTKKGHKSNCTETGLTDGSYCDRCGYVREEQQEIPIDPDAHKWDQGKITVEGDCSHDCILTYTCELCGATAEYNFGKDLDKHNFESGKCTWCGIDDPNASIAPTKPTTNLPASTTKPTNPIAPTQSSKVTTTTKASIAATVKVPSFKLVKGKKQFKVNYKAAAGTAGFQVRYKLANGKWKTKTFKTTKNAVKVIKKLKKGTYSVQIRAFNSSKKYSKWTKAKKVKVK